jgi:hypothetical protein
MSGEIPPSTMSPLRLPAMSRPLSETEQLRAKQAAAADDWNTEVLAELATEQLQWLQHAIEGDEGERARVAELIATPKFVCQPLVPSGLDEVFRDRMIRVARMTAPPQGDRQQQAESDVRYQGTVGLREALDELSASLGNANQRHVKFKLFRIQAIQDGFSARVRYEAAHHDAHSGQQQTATWDCRWTLAEPASRGHGAAANQVDALHNLRLEGIRLEEFEEVRLEAPHGTLFVDCTTSVLGGNRFYPTQILPGIDRWIKVLSREFTSQFGHHGIAIGDVNHDGLDDLYVCDAGGLPNRLYVQQPDGTALDMSVEAGVDLLDESAGALLVDLDNDGDQDLVVGTEPGLQIAENDGLGRFQWRVLLDINTDSFSITAADYDQDGKLDLFVCGYNVRKQDPTRRGLPFPVPYHDATNGGRNVLLRNEGGFSFRDVTSPTGLDQNNSRFSMAAAWEDFDNDGDLDVYVANDFGRNNLYRNDHGRFVDTAAAASVEDHGSGMSVAWGDVDRDGRFDLYVGNMFSAAGNRVTYQRRFTGGRSTDAVEQLRRMARGNTLFMNRTDAKEAAFVDESIEAAVWLGRWAWASQFADLNNDGWPDLVVANGYVTNDDKDDL